MSTQRREVAALAAQIDHEINDLYSPGDDVMGEDLAELLYASGYRKPRIITTVEELHGLPLGSVIIDSDPSVLQMLEKSAIGGAEWAQPNEERIYSSGHVTLPATVLYEPTA